MEISIPRQRSYLFSNLVHASDHYWKILAERARVRLEDQLRDNQQV